MRFAIWPLWYLCDFTASHSLHIFEPRWVVVPSIYPSTLMCIVSKKCHHINNYNLLKMKEEWAFLWMLKCSRFRSSIEPLPAQTHDPKCIPIKSDLLSWLCTACPARTNSHLKFNSHKYFACHSLVTAMHSHSNGIVPTRHITRVAWWCGKPFWHRWTACFHFSVDITTTVAVNKVERTFGLKLSSMPTAHYMCKYSPRGRSTH